MLRKLLKKLNLDIDSFFVSDCKSISDDDWLRLNDLRIRLVTKKHTSGLSRRQAIKLQKLQTIAAKYFTSPFKDHSLRGELIDPFTK